MKRDCFALRAVVLSLVWTATCLGLHPTVAAQAPPDVIHQPYLLDTGLVSRSISFENPTGAPGEGGKAASNLGVGPQGLARHDRSSRARPSSSATSRAPARSATSG